jgi:hypothetical protein
VEWRRRCESADAAVAAATARAEAADAALAATAATAAVVNNLDVTDDDDDDDSGGGGGGGGGGGDGCAAAARAQVAQLTAALVLLRDRSVAADADGAEQRRECLKLLFCSHAAFILKHLLILPSS